MESKEENTTVKYALDNTYVSVSTAELFTNAHLAHGIMESLCYGDKDGAFEKAKMILKSHGDIAERHLKLKERGIDDGAND